MNRPDSQPHQATGTDSYHIIRLRRRSLREWLAALIWLIGLAVLLDYVLSSFREHENQAGVLAGAIFVGLLGAGIIIQIMRGVEARDLHRRRLERYDDLSSEAGSAGTEKEETDDRPPA